jgi:hypothetical protein
MHSLRGLHWQRTLRLLLRHSLVESINLVCTRLSNRDLLSHQSLFFSEISYVLRVYDIISELLSTKLRVYCSQPPILLLLVTRLENDSLSCTPQGLFRRYFSINLLSGTTHVLFPLWVRFLRHRSTPDLYQKVPWQLISNMSSKYLKGLLNANTMQHTITKFPPSFLHLEYTVFYHLHTLGHAILLVSRIERYQ